MSAAMPLIAAAASLVALLLLLRPRRSSARSREEEPRAGSDTALLRTLRAPLSALAGAAAWAFVGGVIGVVVGVAGAVVAWRTLTNARGPSEIRRDAKLRSDYPLVVELLAHAVAAGADVAGALNLVASAVGEPWRSRLGPSLHALELGQAPAAVWAALELDSQASGLGRTLARSQATGVPVSDALRRLASDLREEAELAAHAAARTVEVRAAVPLGVCFLPAFVLVGVVPLVAAILGDLGWVGGR